MKCNFCKNDNYEKVLSQHDTMCYVDKKIFTLIKCKECGLITIENKPTQEEMSKYYENNYYAYSDSESIISKLKKTFLDMSTKLPFLSKRFLLNELYIKAKKEQSYIFDIGCGNGSALLRSKKLGFTKLFGTEIDKNNCEKLLKKGIVIYQTYDFTTLDIKEKFDVIRMSHTLEHMYNPTQAISKSYELLNDQGILLVAVPNFNSFAARVFGKYFCGLQLPTHLYHFDKKVITKILKENNFRIENTFTNGFSGISYSFFTVLRDKYNIVLNRNIELVITLLLLPVEFLLNIFGEGFILTVKCVKK